MAHSIFSIQRTIYSDLVSLLRTAYPTWTVWDEESVGLDTGDLPSMQTWVSQNRPESDLQASMGQHSRLMTLQIRLTVDPQTPLEPVADAIYSLIFDHLSQDKTKTPGNPTFTPLYEESNSSKCGDLEIPITYRSRQA